MKRACLWIVVLVLAAVSCFAQDREERVVLRFMDGAKGIALPHVAVHSRAGVVVSRTDSAGYAVLPLPALAEGGYVVALCNGYKPDTIRRAAAIIYMQPLSVQLPEAVVSNNKISRVLQANNEYVVDYQFAGDDIIVATYSGDNGSKAKLFLINKDGAPADTCRLPAEPVMLYRSCVGRYYCVCTQQFYPLQLWGGRVTLQPPYNTDMLPGLRECEAAVKGNHYYRLGDRQNFAVEYGVIMKDDSVFRHIAGFDEPNVARASMEELMEIMMLLELGKFNKAAKMQLRRKMWDKASYTHIDMPLYIQHDTLVIFDYFNKQLLLCNIAGDSVGSVPIRFNWRDAQNFRVLQDAGTGRLFIHRYDNQAVQTIEELDINTGATTAAKTLIGKPFAEDVKIYNSDIYFLWQDKHSHATRQLFVQREGSSLVSVK